jgi:hypothetical protein
MYYIFCNNIILKSGIERKQPIEFVQSVYNTYIRFEMPQENAINERNRKKQLNSSGAQTIIL